MGSYPTHTHTTHRLSLEKEYSDNEEFERKIYQLHTIHFTKEEYENVTQIKMGEALNFLEAMKRNNTKLWIRHVVVPGLTDGVEHIKALNEYIKTILNVQKVELLPYHVLGVNKYETMNIRYPLEGVEPMDKKLCEEYR